MLRYAALGPAPVVSFQQKRQDVEAYHGHESSIYERGVLQKTYDSALARSLPCQVSQAISVTVS